MIPASRNLFSIQLSSATAPKASQELTEQDKDRIFGKDRPQSSLGDSQISSMESALAPKKKVAKRNPERTKSPVYTGDDKSPDYIGDDESPIAPPKKRARRARAAAKKNPTLPGPNPIENDNVLTASDLADPDLAMELHNEETALLEEFDAALKDNLSKNYREAYLNGVDRNVVTELSSDAIFRRPTRGGSYNQWHLILAGDACEKYCITTGETRRINKERLIDDVRCELLCFGQLLPFTASYDDKKLSIAAWEEKVYRQTTKTLKDDIFKYVQVNPEVAAAAEKAEAAAKPDTNVSNEEKPHCHMIVRYDNRNGLKSSHLWESVLRKAGISVRVQICDVDEANQKTFLAQKRSLERYLTNTSKPGGVDLTPSRSIGFTLMPETVRAQEQSLTRNLRQPCSEPEFYGWVLSGEITMPHTLAQFKSMIRRKCDEHNSMEIRLQWYQEYYKYEPWHKRLQ